MGDTGRALGGAAKGATMGATIGSAVPVIGTAVGAVAGGIIGGIAGFFSGGDPSPEELAAIELQKAYEGQIILSPEQRRIRLDALKKVGALSPEMEKELLQVDTELKNIKVDPKFKAAQMDALNNLSAQGREGLMLEDRVALEDIKRQEAQALRGQEDAILQNMQARGMGGAGAELAARLQASQSAADRSAQQGARIAAMQQGRRMDALSRSGQLAGQMGQQEFANQAQVGTAQDAINRFNVGSKQSVQQRNVAARNQAQEYNLNYDRDLESNRVGTANRQREMDVNARLNWADAKNQQAIGKAKAGMGVAERKTEREQRDDAGFAGTMGSLGGLVGAASDSGALGEMGGALSSGVTRFRRLFESDADQMQREGDYGRSLGVRPGG